MECDTQLEQSIANNAANQPSERRANATSTLVPNLDLTQAQPLHSTLVRLLASGGVMLDASAVERLSTPCAQVLLVASRAAAGTDTPFTIVNASDAFCSAVDDLGLQPEFAMWMG